MGSLALAKRSQAFAMVTSSFFDTTAKGLATTSPMSPRHFAALRPLARRRDYGFGRFL